VLAFSTETLIMGEVSHHNIIDSGLISYCFIFCIGKVSVKKKKKKKINNLILLHFSPIAGEDG